MIGALICLFRGHDFVGHIYQVCWRCGKIKFDEDAFWQDFTVHAIRAIQEYYGR